jgi:membrane-bound lytic murein transglycosylase D
MKKLLLLTLLPLIAFMSSFAGIQSVENDFNLFLYSDSTVKEEVIANPRAGFKNLFVTAETGNTGGYTTQLHPKAISFVQDYMEKEADNLAKMKSWGKPYFDMMDKVLAKHGLPTELKYLSVIESQLKANATSWVGAVGPWQFMPETARLMGLKVTGKVDERKNYYKSTQAAARYLTDLYNIYNDWLLVIAAYNTGPGNVNKAIRKSGSRNFWDLQYYLPAESRNHVKKFIATHYIMEGDGGETTLTKSENEQRMMQQQTAVQTAALSNENLVMVTLTGKYNAGVIAQNLQMNITEFNRLNPNFDRQLSANGEYTLRLPADKALAFQANKPQILEQSIQLMLAGGK